MKKNLVKTMIVLTGVMADRSIINLHSASAGEREMENKLIRIAFFFLIVISLLWFYGTSEAKTVYENNFDGAAAGWVAQGLWHKTGHRSNSGGYSFYYGQEGKWSYNTGYRNTGQLTSPPIDLTSATSPQLSFYHWYKTEIYQAADYDRKIVEISSDGGLTWKELMKWTSRHLNLTSWKKEVFDISTYAGKIIHIRFRFDTIDNMYNDFEGWYIDDVMITGEGDDYIYMIPYYGDTSKPAVFKITVTDISAGETQIAIENITEDPGFSLLDYASVSIVTDEDVDVEEADSEVLVGTSSSSSEWEPLEKGSELSKRQLAALGLFFNTLIPLTKSATAIGSLVKDITTVITSEKEILPDLLAEQIWDNNRYDVQNIVFTYPMACGYTFFGNKIRGFRVRFLYNTNGKPLPQFFIKLSAGQHADSLVWHQDSGIEILSDRSYNIIGPVYNVGY